MPPLDNDHFFEATRRLALRAPLRGISTISDITHLNTLRDWFPLTLHKDNIIWRYLPDRFTAPFFLDLLSQQAPEQRQACITPMDWLDRLEPALPPTAFIFHTSRCGSTLLTQMLATLRECIVISEAPIIDACLRAPPPGLTEKQHLALLRQLILALGQRRNGETHCIIKLDSWHLPYLPLLRAAFPAAQCWFLYREPAAIVASHRRQRGAQMVPGMIFPLQIENQTSAQELAPGDLDGYCQQVLEYLFRHALQQREHLQWLNYSQLPSALWEHFLPQLDLQCSPAQIAAMRERTKFHSKNQTYGFQGDPISPALPHALPSTPIQIDQLYPLYQQIEQLRESQHKNTATTHNPLS